MGETLGGAGFGGRDVVTHCRLIRSVPRLWIDGNMALRVQTDKNVSPATPTAPAVTPVPYTRIPFRLSLAQPYS